MHNANRSSRCSRRWRRVGGPALASTPTFWTVSTQPDFLKGDVENLSIDSDGRVFLGPVDHAGRRNLGAVPLDRPVRRRRHALGRNRQRRPGPEDRARRQDVDLLRRRRDGSARAGARAQRRSLRRRPLRTARSTRSPPTARRRPSSIPTTSTSGRWPSRPTARVFAATGEKGNIYRITPDGKGSLFYKTNTTNVVVARDRQERAT